MNFEIKIIYTEQSRIESCDFDNIEFGKIFSDHMFRIDYENGEWKNPQIMPYGNISVSPALSALHYGQAIFEGMKAYKDAEGNPQLFRPLENQKRLNFSARRMCMPELPEEIFMEAVSKLVKLDQDWIPSKEGSSLYIRPFMFATDDFVGVRPSSKYTFMIYSCPVNSYYSNPLRVKVEETYVRACPGGVGMTKSAGNYGASMYPAKKAQEAGFHQVLWTDGETHKYLEETGTTNFFAVIGDKVITPALNGTILEGITRDSIITVLRDWGITVEEKRVSIDELIEAHGQGMLKEAFGSGTAATIAPVCTIHYGGVDYDIETGNPESIAARLLKHLDEIKRSEVADKFGWMVKV